MYEVMEMEFWNFQIGEGIGRACEDCLAAEMVEGYEKELLRACGSFFRVWNVGE